MQAHTCQCTCHAQECTTRLSSPTDALPVFCLPQHSAERKKAPPPGPRITNLVEDLGSENRLRRGIFEDQGRAEMMLCGKREASSYLKAPNWEDAEEGGGASWNMGQGIHLVMADLSWSNSDGRELWMLHAYPALAASWAGDCLECLLGARKAF